MISTTQPVFVAVQIEKSVLHFKGAETGSFRQAVQFGSFVCDQAEFEVVEIRMLRRPKTGFQVVYDVGFHPFFACVEVQFP